MNRRHLYVAVVAGACLMTCAVLVPASRPSEVARLMAREGAVHAGFEEASRGGEFYVEVDLIHPMEETPAYIELTRAGWRPELGVDEPTRIYPPNGRRDEWIGFVHSWMYYVRPMSGLDHAVHAVNRLVGIDDEAVMRHSW